MNLKKYFIGKVGTDYDIQVKFLIPYVSIGSGKYSILNDKSVAFSGSIDVVGFKGSFSLALEIGSGNSCVITLDNYKQKATYREDGNSLIVTIPDGPEKGTIEIQAWGKGTWFNPDIPNGHYVWVGQP